jgi:signal transduction histidine kinase
MIDQMQHQLAELKEQLRALTVENQRLSERAEDIFILSRINHTLRSLSQPEPMILSTLKIISDYKGLPFCAYGIEEKNQIVKPLILTNFTESSRLKTIYLNLTITRELQNGLYFSDHKSRDNILLYDSFREDGFTPDSILLIPYLTTLSKTAVFIFADRDNTPNRLSEMRTFLITAVQILASKLDILDMQEELKKYNLNLEKAISEKTSELWNTNTILRSEIEERKITADRLRQMNEKLNNFVYRVSHDLRAPITSVEGLITVIKFERKAGSGKVDEYINILEERIQSLDRFIRDILSHSRVSNTEIQLEKIHFKQIITECFDELNYMENHDKIIRSIRISGSEFINDRIRIYEIFRNIISNAIKYSDPAKENNRIRIKIKTDRKSTSIEIQDTGIGIDNEVLPHIFEMFFRGSLLSKGTGIGLYIVREAVKKLKGNIKVASTPGQGTRFSIQLPNRIEEQ